MRANVEDAVFDPATGTTHDFLTGPSEPPSPQESGWKDTFVAPPNGQITVAARFSGYTGKYLFHCHNLEHEDLGMMGDFEITA